MNPDMGAEPVADDHIEYLENNNPAMNPMIDHGQQQQSYGNIVDSQIQYSIMPHSTYDQYVYQEMKPMYMPEQPKDAGEIEYVQLFDPNGMYGNVQSSQQEGLDPSRSPPPPPRIYKPCVVCNDKSSGYHYGVSSCEGCKGFFRRSVQKNMQYTCHKEKNCIINKVTRNRCQYCRLQKCFQMGMSKEAVRNDRHKKKKQKIDGTALSPDEVTEPEQSLIETIRDAHESTYPVLLETDANISTLMDVKKEVNGNGDDNILWERIGELSSSGIVKIVEFAKKLPGFRTLTTTDQITLLKAACLEVMILRLCTRYDVEKDALIYEAGNVLRQQLQVGGFGPLASTIFNFAASLKVLDLDSTEFALLSAICLASGDRSGLQRVQDIEKMQEPILEALKHYVRSRRKDQPQTFAKLLMKLTDLRSISVKGMQFRHAFLHVYETMGYILNYETDETKAAVNAIVSPSKNVTVIYQRDYEEDGDDDDSRSVGGDSQFEVVLPPQGTMPYGLQSPVAQYEEVPYSASGSPGGAENAPASPHFAPQYDPNSTAFAQVPTTDIMQDIEAAAMPELHPYILGQSFDEEAYLEELQELSLPGGHHHVDGVCHCFEDLPEQEPPPPPKKPPECLIQ